VNDFDEGFVDYDEWGGYEDLKRETPLPTGFTDLLNGFAAQSLAKLVGQIADSNAVYSPACLLLAIGMLMSSSEKDAAKEIRLQLERCAGAGRFSQDELEEGLSALVKHMGSNPLADVRTACAAWLARSVLSGGSDPRVLERIDRVYDAEVRGADFGTQAAAAEIRDWIGSKTNGMLKPEVQTSGGEIALLVSCLYARLSWALEFDSEETDWGDFFITDGETGSARFMHRSFDGMRYCVGKGFTRVTLPCEGECSVDFLMPDDASALSDSGFVRDAFSKPDNHRADVDLYLPRFEIESEIDGKRLLNGLRMNGMFKMQGDSPLVGGPMKVDDVVHGAKVKVDESGLEGAAYTMMPVCAGLPPEREPLEEVTIRLDRPFAFRVATDDSVPLFMGRVGDPTVPARERFFENEGNRALRNGNGDPSERVRKVELQIGGLFQGWETATLTADGELKHEHGPSGIGKPDDTTERIGADGFERICGVLREVGAFGWEESYIDLGVLDGTQWSLSIEDVDGAAFHCSGSNEYPKGFDDLRRAMGVDFDG
jgi:serine protease inhibitor